MQIKTEIDLIAVFALIVSLSSLAWNYMQWRLNSARFRIIATGDMLTIPDDNLGSRISVRISNIGGRKIQITHVSFFGDRYGKGTNFLPVHSYPEELPIFVDVGEAKSIYFLQDRLLEKIGKREIWCAVSMSHLSKSAKLPVKLNKNS